MILIPGTASKKLAEELENILKCKNADVEIMRFPDSECYVRIDTDLSGEDVVIIQSTYPDPNLVELLLIQASAREYKLNSLTTVIPYYGYARQDKSFKPGEAVSASNLAKHLQMASDRVILVDIHNMGTLDAFSIQSINKSVMPEIGKFLAGLPNPPDMLLSPDKGSLDRVEIAARAAGKPFDHLEKTRLDGETVKMAPKELDAQGKNVAIVDDIIATGGTIIRAATMLREQGAGKIYAACTHGLYTNNAIERLQKACDAVYSSDTIENPTSSYSAAEAVHRALTE